MLTEFIYSWNPFNLYGSEVDVEDLIINPLKTSETLREDSLGCIRRIQAPPSRSTFWQRIYFRLQTYLNEKGHLDAIDKIISFFHANLVKNPQVAHKLKEFNHRANRLYSLKNDYYFMHLKQGNSEWIDLRLLEIKQQAYWIFIRYYKVQVIKEEQNRKKKFERFHERIEKAIEQLDFQYLFGLHQARLLIVASVDRIQALFEERVRSLQHRLKIIKKLQKQMDKMEKFYKGKFTIPYAEDYFHKLRARLRNEVHKISIEAECIIGNLMLNYRITPYKQEVKTLLSSIKIDPEKIRFDQMNLMSFQEELDDEIKQVQTFFKAIFKS